MTDGTKIRQIHERAKNNNRRTKHFFIFALVIIFVSFLVFVFVKFFDIKKIEILQPEINAISEADIMKSMGIEKGDNLLLVGKKKSKKNLLQDYPYIKDVKITKKLPSTIKMKLEFYSPEMAVELCGKLFVLSSDGKVLYSVGEKEELPENVTLLYTPAVSECIQGRRIAFESEEYLEILTDIYSAFEKYSLSDKLTYIDISDKFNIKMQIDGKLDVIFGTFEKAEAKAEILSLDYESEFRDKRAGVDISNGNDAIVYPYSD